MTLCASAAAHTEKRAGRVFLCCRFAHSSFVVLLEGKQLRVLPARRAKGTHKNARAMACERTHEHELGYGLDVVVEHVWFRVEHRAVLA